MIVRIDPAGLKQTNWHEYLVRFIFGGLITAIAGLIADKWGPTVAGLFLAFPAIFPAGATLVQRQERERKERKGLQGEQRGIEAAADDASGAAVGSIALVAFAVICWLWIPRFAPALVLASATFIWLLTACCIWFLHKRTRLTTRAAIAGRRRA